MAQPFTIYVIQSAHTDIGYTHPQEQIGWMYLDFYDRVLDLCARDEIAPVEHRFKWTCETSWQVRNYVTHRPERIAEFLHFVRTGQIEVTGSYLHFTDLIDSEAYQYSLKWAADFCKPRNLPLRTIMHCDINGWAWSIPDLLAEQNIPYFCSQVHIDSATDPLGKRGSIHYHWVLENGDNLRPDLPIRVPQGFYWQGPRGNKVLHWLNEHYHLGNFLGLSGNHHFPNEKGRYFWESDLTPADELYALAKRELPRYLDRVRENGYTHDSMMISTGGFFVDNSPPDDRWCEIVARWNDEHTDIQLRTATISEWMDKAATFENLPTYQVAWPDHWAHGIGSMTNRIAQARKLQRSREQAIKLVGDTTSDYAKDHLSKARDQELLALEHTFNAWMTSAVPNAEPISHLQAAKELTFHKADLHYREAIAAALRARVPPSSDEVRLYVPVDETGMPARLVEFSATDLELDPEKQLLIALDGSQHRFQRDSHAQDMPRYAAVLPVEAPGLSRFMLAERVATEAAPASNATSLENGSWRLHVDPTSGALTSLYDVARGREWVGEQAHWGFGQLVSESVVHPWGRMANGNRGRMIALGNAGEPLLERWIDAPVYEHITPTIQMTPGFEAGAVFDALQLEGVIGSLGRVEITWRLYHALPLVELIIDWDKGWNDKPEAAYVAFPFAADSLRFETAGGFFQPGSFDAGGQLPGTCSSYYTIQRVAKIGSGDASLLWLPLDAPLVMPQEIDYSRWETTVPWAWNGFIASMPVNHYWHTNFATSQRGALRLRYRFFSAGDDTEAAIRTALPVEAVGWR